MHKLNWLFVPAMSETEVEHLFPKSNLYAEVKGSNIGQQLSEEKKKKKHFMDFLH